VPGAKRCAAQLIRIKTMISFTIKQSKSFVQAPIRDAFYAK
jgi:hypothetical protein